MGRATLGADAGGGSVLPSADSFIIAVSWMGNGYFLLIGFIRFSFCTVKLLGCIWGNSDSQELKRADSAAEKALASIFFDTR
jgi:hypothetical protein